MKLKVGVNSCDYENTLRHRGRAGGNGLRGDSIENLLQRIPKVTRGGFEAPNARVVSVHKISTVSADLWMTHHGGRRVLRSCVCWVSGLGIGFWLRGVQP